MRLTSFTDYTLRVLIYLGAQSDSKQLATIGDIASAYGISENHLMKVVHHLGRQGYIETTRGKGGGMRLARAPEEIRIGDVVRNSEEDLAVVECFQPGKHQCPIFSICTLQTTLDRALQAFLEVLDGQTLADMLKPRTELATLFRKTGTPAKEPPAGRGRR
jgi:Rrf2 family transcriptional regulator, nitric oxide-sensitive transcriptional repressor